MYDEVEMVQNVRTALVLQLCKWAGVCMRCQSCVCLIKVVMSSSVRMN